MKLLLTTLFILDFGGSFSFGYGTSEKLIYPVTEITGEVFVYPSTREVYIVTWESWNQTNELYSNVKWTVTGGTVIESDKHSITIEWNELEKQYMDGFGQISVQEDLGNQEAELKITITNTAESPSEFCDGILGPPIIAENFGSGNNPGSPLPIGTTTYQYNSNCALNVGQYTIVNNSIGCRSLWHGISQDHTGNPNGYFFMVNANERRNEIYRKRVYNLSSQFSYEFSAWVGNLYNTSGAQEPNIKFEIYNSNDGKLISSSGVIAIHETTPTFQWQKVAFMFQIPSGVSSIDVVLTNTRRETDNIGNDMVIDDIAFAPCYPNIVASFSNSANIGKFHLCNNGNATLFSSWPGVIPFQNPQYQWQRSIDEGIHWSNIPGANNISYLQIESSPGIYHYRILAFESSNPSLTLISNELIFYVQKLVVEAGTTNLFACNGSNASGNIEGEFTLQYSDPDEASTLAYTSLWSPSTYINYPTSNPTFINIPSPGAPPPPNGSPLPPTTYSYTLTVTNSNYGCSSSNIQTVKVYNPRKVGVANAFAPNQAPPNNVFVPINIEDYPASKFWVYNRWGQTVFYSQGPTKLDYSWNGTFNGSPQPMDVYTWTVELTGCPTNITSSSGEGIPHGDVTLVR